MKRSIFCMCFLFAFVCLIGCSENNEASDHSSNNKEGKTSSELAGKKEDDETDKYNLEDEINARGGSLEICGEVYDALYGEEGAMIWKKVDATFDTREHYVIAFVASKKLSEKMSLLDDKKNIYCTGWIRWFKLATVDFSIKSIGEDIFEVITDHWKWESDCLTFFNGKEEKVFSLYSMEVPQIYHGNEKYELSYAYRMNRFNNGKMILKLQYHYRYSGYDMPLQYEYLWVDEYGNYSIIENNEIFSDTVYNTIYHDEKSYYVSDAGALSDGLFYYQGIFYDYNMNPILNIRQQGYTPYADTDIYTPEFCNGICTMVAYKNGRFWTFDINRDGEMLTSATEIKTEMFDEWICRYEENRKKEKRKNGNSIVKSDVTLFPTATPLPTATSIPEITPEPIRNLYGMQIVIGDHYSPEKPKEPTNAQERAIQQYRQKLFEKYNFTMQSKGVAGWGEMQDTCTKSILAREPVAELFELDYRFVAEPLTKGCFYDLATLDEFDFSEDKWNKYVKEVMTIGNGIYGMSTSKSEPRGGIIWNKRLWEEAGLDPNLPYDFQLSGEWTWSKFMEVCERLTRDVDGDGVTDIYALASQNASTVLCLVASTGSDFFVKDENGYLVNNMESEDVLSALDFAVELYNKGYDMPQPEGSEWNFFQKAFSEGKAAMQFNEEYICNPSYYGYRPDDEIGFIMPPKPDDKLSYHSYVCDNITIIPSCYDEKNASNIAFAYNLYTMSVPGYDDSTDWKEKYYNHFDDVRAVDETIVMFNDGVSVHYLAQAIVPGNLWEDLLYKYPFSGTTPKKTVKSIKKEWDDLLKEVNKAY